MGFSDRSAKRKEALRAFEHAAIKALVANVASHEADAAAARAEVAAHRAHIKYERAHAKEAAAWNAYEALSEGGAKLLREDTSASTIAHHESMIVMAEKQAALCDEYGKERRARLAELKRQVADDEAFYRALERINRRAS